MRWQLVTETTKCSTIHFEVKFWRNSVEYTHKLKKFVVKLTFDAIVVKRENCRERDKRQMFVTMWQFGWDCHTNVNWIHSLNYCNLLNDSTRILGLNWTEDGLMNSIIHFWNSRDPAKAYDSTVVATIEASIEFQRQRPILFNHLCVATVNIQQSC